MTLHRLHHVSHALVAAGLLVGVAAAQAASGYAVTTQQEGLIAQGMSTAQVRQALGRPERQIRYGSEPGPTFTYNVADKSGMLFDVDFNAAGQVMSMGERMDMDASN